MRRVSNQENGNSSRKVSHALSDISPPIPAGSPRVKATGFRLIFVRLSQYGEVPTNNLRLAWIVFAQKGCSLTGQ